MSDIPTIPLIINQTYTICDYYGMMAFKGIYKGMLEDETLSAEPYEMMLFKAVDASDGKYPWAGVVPEVELDGDSLRVSLRAFYYGKTARSLKHVNSSERDKPKWRKVV